MPYNVIVGNVLVFVLEVNQAYARYLPPSNVVFGNVIVFVLEETIECEIYFSLQFLCE